MPLYEYDIQDIVNRSGDGQDYLTRLQKAMYVAPSGTFREFTFIELSRSITHRIGAFEFSGVNGTLHQDKGVGGEVYPMEAIFYGIDCDLEAEIFFGLLKEKGRGILRHPRYGQRAVQVLSCTQSENCVSALGEVRCIVEFQESLGREFVSPEAGVTYEIADLIKGFDETFPVVYGEGIVTSTLDQKFSLKDAMSIALEKVDSALGALATGDNVVASVFGAEYINIVNNIDEYVQAPAEYARSIMNMISAPATLVGRIDSKLVAYKSLLDSIPFTNISTPSREIKNALVTDELIGTSTVVAVANAITEAVRNTSTVQRDDQGRALITVPQTTVGFQTRGEALASAVYLRDIFIGLVDYLDLGQDAFKNKTLYEMYLQVLESYTSVGVIVTKAMQGVLNLSFELPAKRSLILTNDSTFIDECNIHYGGISDATLDFFIQTNNLNNDEIKLLPKGKEIIYYA